MTHDRDCRNHNSRALVCMSITLCPGELARVIREPNLGKSNRLSRNGVQRILLLSRTEIVCRYPGNPFKNKIDPPSIRCSEYSVLRTDCDVALVALFVRLVKSPSFPRPSMLYCAYQSQCIMIYIILSQEREAGCLQSPIKSPTSPKVNQDLVTNAEKIPIVPTGGSWG
jgi:hypothetical protein